MEILNRVPAPLLAIVAGILWFVYYAVCSVPTGAPFIYADI